MSMAELEHKTPCCHASVSILVRRLLAAGLLKSYAPEFGLPRTYALDANAVSSIINKYRDPNLGRLLSILPVELEQAASR